ncbi:MAG: VCBS repeat-containing protein [Flavobacteriaceae bacterium]|nr:VCBS repeat-containing protein [Flavobacteriaceae bacterium]
MKRLNLLLFIIGVFILHISCSNTNDNKQFTLLSTNDTGVDFNNQLKEDNSFNYFTYPYIYMGGGVSVGDINNDNLDDIFFTGNMTPNKLFLNKGNLNFEDITSSSNTEGDNRWYTGSTMVDINNDGYLDIYVSVGGLDGIKNNELYINNGDDTFTEMAKEYGVDDIGNGVQATFFDYDKDGDLDLYVANYPMTSFDAPRSYYSYKMQNTEDHETDNLYRNDGSSFTKVTDEAGLRTYGLTLSATIGDLNNDSYPDIYISNDFSSPDFMYMNNGDGTFKDIVKESTNHTSFYGMGVDIADFNNDHYLDYIQVDMDAKDNRRSKANMASMNPELFWSTVNYGFHYQYMHNTLQLNRRVEGDKPFFSNISRLSGISSTDWSWGPLLADFDNDGWKDLFISNGTRREVNNKDYFNEIKLRPMSKDSLLYYTKQIPSEPIANFAFRNNKNLTFSDVSTDWGLDDKNFSNGATYADLDNDGDLEIIVNNIDQEAQIYRNNSINNYVRVELKGSGENIFGIDSRVYVETENSSQMQELTMTRGFQSSVAPYLNFGLGKDQLIKSLKVVWSNGNVQTLDNIKINSTVELNIINSSLPKEDDSELSNLYFENVDIVEHKHEENEYDDYIKEVLLPHENSRLGPGIVTGDINGDSLEDFIVGGAKDQSTAFYIQKSDGSFTNKNFAFSKAHSKYEDMDMILEDFDNDGDKDLYIVSGGNEFDPNTPILKDRLYVNNGSGSFSYNENSIPQNYSSGMRVTSNDFDKDGDMDLFVGGRVVPGSYPLPADSYLLENLSDSNGIKFINVNESQFPFKDIGLVTSSVWTDYNNDGWTDLIVVGEWTPIRFLKNIEGNFTEDTSLIDVDSTRGWWYDIISEDFDKDGDMDLVIGNLGNNYKYQTSGDETFDIFYNDFDKNNSGDIVLSYYNDGEQYPLRGRQCSSDQIPAIKTKFQDYDAFSIATLEDVYSEPDLENSLHYFTKTFSSVYLENNGNSFKMSKLPVLSQLSSVNKILSKDIDKDGYMDIIISGNMYNSEVETPRNDGSVGVYLNYNPDTGFEAIPTKESGLFLNGDVKDMEIININKIDYIISAKNDDLIEFTKIK